MINKECFTTEWIAQKSIELKYNDKNLIEKVIRAFSLLEMLAASGCPFHFKGGTSSFPFQRRYEPDADSRRWLTPIVD